MTTTTDEPLKNKFTDRKGREWTIDLSFALLRVIRTTLKVDLGDAKNFAHTWMKLVADDDQMLAVVWECVKEGAGDATFDDFLAGMQGQQLEEARDALLEAIYFFTRPEIRPVIRAATEGAMKVYRKLMDDATNEVEEIMKGATTRAIKRLGTMQHKSPASLATSMKRGRSGARARR